MNFSLFKVYFLASGLWLFTYTFFSYFKLNLIYYILGSPMAFGLLSSFIDFYFLISFCSFYLIGLFSLLMSIFGPTLNNG